MTRWSWLRRGRAGHLLAGAALGAVLALAIVAVVGAGPGQRSEGVKLVGQYRIEVFDAGGALVAVRDGYNAITLTGKAQLANCVSGLGIVGSAFCATDLTPPGFTGVIVVGNGTAPCDPTSLGANGIHAFLAKQTATNTRVSTGVWRTSATFSFSSSATLTEAAAAAAIGSLEPTATLLVGASVSTFNCLLILPTLTVAPGDSAVVTITFTVQ